MAILRLLVLGYIIAIVLVIIGSWVPMESDGPVRQAFTSLRRITDPVLEPVRRVIPPVGGMLDLSPTIVLFVLLTIYRLL
jgi:YggT family protein